jgi:hypothetical protein
MNEIARRPHPAGRLAITALLAAVGIAEVRADDPSVFCVRSSAEEVQKDWDKSYWTDVAGIAETCRKGDLIDVRDVIAAAVCDMTKPTIGSDYVTCTYRGEMRTLRGPEGATD